MRTLEHVTLGNLNRFIVKFLKLHSPSMFAVKAKIIECAIINPALSLLMKYLFIGQRQKAPIFFGFHLSAFRNHEGSTFTGKDPNKLNYRIGPK